MGIPSGVEGPWLGHPAGGEYARAARGAVVLSIVGNTVLFGLKLWVGIASDSVALRADAWHTISDTLSSLVVLAGVRLSVRPADCKHPFGHGRYELVSAVLVGVLLGLVSLYFAINAVESVFSTHRADFGVSAIVVTAVSVAVKEGMAQYAFGGARRTGNRALRADGWHHRSDALSSVVVLIGIGVGGSLAWIDGGLGLAVAVLIGHVAVVTVRDAASAIVGERPPAGVQSAVERLVAEEVPTLSLQPHDFRWHNYVHRQELTFHIVLPSDMQLEEATGITQRLEERMRSLYRIDATVRIETGG